MEFKAEADIAADKVIRKTISKYFPSHTILSEEKAASNRFKEFTWLIDPIDGTTNFVCGFPMWAISIALVHKEHPVLAVINIPQLKKLYVSEKGRGVYCNSKRVHVDSISNLKQTVIALDAGYYQQRRKAVISAIKKLGENITNIAMINSVSTAFPLIASGNLQGLIHNCVKIYELPPGLLLIKEAGGKITDLKGRKIIFNIQGPQSYEILATNGRIHNKILKHLS